MAGATEMCVAESKDRGVIVLVTGTIVIGFKVVFSFDEHGFLICFRAQLNHSEGCCSPGVGVSHVFRSDKWVYELNQVAVFCLNILRFGLSISNIIAGCAANDNNCPNAAEFYPIH